MKKGLITIILTFILIFNTYSPTFATTPDPAAAIPVTAYEVYTYFTLVLTYMGVEYKNAQERKQWLEDEYGPDTPTYKSVEDILRQAKINFSNEPPNYNPKPEPRQIAIPVPDSLIDNLYNKYISYFQENNVIISDEVINSLHSDAPYPLKCAIVVGDGVTNYYVSPYNFTYTGSFNPDDLQFVLTVYTVPTKKYHLELLLPGNTSKFGSVKLVYSESTSKFTGYLGNSYSYSFTNASIVSQFTIGGPVAPDLNLPKLPVLTKSWTSPYTGMQTVTMPLTTTGIESPVEVPVIPGEYVEPAPDEVTNPITPPVTDPLINPETGLPFIDPETGLPIFPSTPLVPVTPITPIPQPEELTQPKDYTPNLTEISNGIKQLPERIINPIKKLFIPDKVSKIDFSPLNVPITKKFPFSIPFDLANMFQNFSAGGEPPKWDINLVFMDYSETITIDLAMFEKWAEILRFFVFIGFNIGLILVTRNLIRG